MSSGARVLIAKGDIDRWWHPTPERRDAPRSDWASDIAQRMGGTRRPIAVERAPDDSPLSEFDTSRPFSDVVAEARAKIAAAQLARQRSIVQ